MREIDCGKLYYMIVDERVGLSQVRFKATPRYLIIGAEKRDNYSGVKETNTTVHVQHLRLVKQNSDNKNDPVLY